MKPIFSADSSQKSSSISLAKSHGQICYNAGMIIFLVPIVGALTTRCAHFDMIHLGSYLSALSPLWIVAFPGHGRLTNYMPLLVNM